MKSFTEHAFTNSGTLIKIKPPNTCLWRNNHYSATWNSIFQTIIGQEVSQWNCPNYFQRINWSVTELFYGFGVFYLIVKDKSWTNFVTLNIYYVHLFVSWTEAPGHFHSTTDVPLSKEPKCSAHLCSPRFNTPSEDICSTYFTNCNWQRWWITATSCVCPYIHLPSNHSEHMRLWLIFPW